jgi:DNA-binding GntR family transcriptional regulator
MTTTADGALLTETVHDRLRGEIVDGTLAPGTPLSVPALAARLEVSRSPVRESVQQLIHEGLAVYTPRAGARVAVLDDTTMRSLLQVREVLEGLAVREAVGHATLADLDHLRGMLAEQEAMLRGSADAVRDQDMDLVFHTRIRQLSRNVPLEATLRRLHVQGYLYRSLHWQREQDRRFAVSEHSRILEAMEAGDAVGAEAAARAHVAGVCVRLMRRPD